MLDIAALLDRAPDRLRRLANHIATGRGALGRMADASRYRYSADEQPTLPPPTDAAVRLLIGPANSAGQSFRWSRAVEQLPGVSAVAMHGIGAGPYRPDADLRVPVAVYQRSQRWHAEFEEYLAQQTHVMWESGLALLGRRYANDVSRELSVLRGRGVQGALVFHGSDIRPPSLHAASSAWSPFRSLTGTVRTLEEQASSNAMLAGTAGVPVFVSTPDLLRWLPDATWLPVVVDPSRWRRAAPTIASGRPVVAHAPTQRWLKGTDLIEPMLRHLADEGVIEYRQVVGVPHASMPAFYAEADIVLDQFLLGSYGVTACEAMASGSLVMGHIDEVARSEVRERTGMELPVHEATVESLEAELRRAASDPDSFEAIRAAGPGFVEQVHDGKRSAAVVAPFLGLSA